jgi:hypothetical protein
MCENSSLFFQVLKSEVETYFVIRDVNVAVARTNDNSFFIGVN